MPWIDGYTSTDEISMITVEWPEHKDCCAVVVVDYSVPCGDEGVTAQAIDSAESLFGDSVNGEWLLETLATYGTRATFVVPPIMAERYPDVVAKAAQAGHEIALGGLNKADITHLSLDEERRLMAQATRKVAEVANVTPTGWFSLPRTTDDFPGGITSPHTLSLLREAGYRYFGNGMADDIPYYTVTDPTTGTSLLTLPYYYSFDAQFFLFFPGIGRGSGLMNIHKLEQNWNDEMDGILRFGRQLSLVFQPCLIHWGSARALLEAMLTRMRDDERVWQATSAQCADWWLKRYPASTALHLVTL